MQHGLSEAHISILPTDTIQHVFRFVNVNDHPKLARVCKSWNVEYCKPAIWRHLLSVNFPEEFGVAKEHKQWRREYMHCVHKVSSLELGEFRAASRCEYSMPDIRSLLSTTVVKAYDEYLFLERQVLSDRPGLVSFCFRSICTGKVAHSFAPIPTAVLPQTVANGSVQNDMTIFEDQALLVYFLRSGAVKGLQMIDLPSVSPASDVDDDQRWDYKKPLSGASADGASRVNFRPRQDTSNTSHTAIGLRLMTNTLSSANVWVPPNHHTNVLLRCRPPFIVLTGRDMQMWRMDAKGGAAAKTISLPGYGPNVVAVNWNTQYLVIAERTQRDGCGSVIRLMSMESKTKASAQIVQSPFPIEPSYFDLFQTVDRFVILASMGSRLGKACSNCPMYSTFCVEVPYDSKVPPRVNRIGHIDSCSGNDTESPDQRFTTSTLFKPQGLLYGNRGPFLACSNGVDVLWYSFDQEHKSTVKQSAKLLSLPMLDDFDHTSVDRWSSSGCRKVFFAGSKLVALWTDFHAKQRSVWVLEPGASASPMTT